MQVQEKSQKTKRSSAEKETIVALRAQLQVEIQNKKQCSYQPYECTQLCIDGYAYCMKHILNEKNAPFKQCSFVYNSNNKRCPNAAPKTDKKDIGLCNEHALKATLARSRQNCRYPTPHTAEALLHSLAHYVKKPRSRLVSGPTTVTNEEESHEETELKATKGLDPFTEVDVSTQLNPSYSEGLEPCSDSESDVDVSTLGTVWHDAQADSSDNESIDSEQEDYLKHSNVYTAEEITIVTREKLVRLQSLYIEQYRHLQYLLKERRRKYLHALKREKETCCNIYSQVRDNTREQRLYKKLKAYNKYHKTYGIEAILSKRSRDLRAKITEGVSSRPQNHTKCAFSEGGVKCGEKALPLARHCRKHILEDQNQVLFRPCGRFRADVECTTPVEAIFDNTTCNLHKDIPRLRSYSQTRKDSDSEYDESLETSNIQASLVDLSTTCNVKTELIDFNMPPELPKMDTLPTMLFEESSNAIDLKSKYEQMEDESFSMDIVTDINTSRNRTYEFGNEICKQEEKGIDEFEELPSDKESSILESKDTESKEMEETECSEESQGIFSKSVDDKMEETVEEKFDVEIRDINVEKDDQKSEITTDSAIEEQIKEVEVSKDAINEESIMEASKTANAKDDIQMEVDGEEIVMENKEENKETDATETKNIEQLEQSSSAKNV